MRCDSALRHTRIYEPLGKISTVCGFIYSVWRMTASNFGKLVAFGFLIKELRLSPTALKVWFATLQIGTWTNGAAGVAAAFLGASSKLMPTINEKFPPPHGVDSSVVTNLLQVCGVTIMVALILTIYGLLQRRGSDE